MNHQLRIGRFIAANLDQSKDRIEIDDRTIDKRPRLLKGGVRGGRDFASEENEWWISCHARSALSTWQPKTSNDQKKQSVVFGLAAQTSQPVALSLNPERG